MGFSIKDLSKKFNLSRGTLLYYDSIGLLKPSERSQANYRVYTEENVNRLQQVCHYREMGLPLEEIKALLNSSKNEVNEVLEKRLFELSDEILKLRRQQLIIIDLLKNKKLLKSLRTIDRDTLVEVLTFAGFDDMGIRRLHAELERISPDAHQEFLDSLGIDGEEIQNIREYAKELDKEIVPKGRS